MPDGLVDVGDDVGDPLEVHVRLQGGAPGVMENKRKQAQLVLWHQKGLFFGSSFGGSFGILWGFFGGSLRILWRSFWGFFWGFFIFKGSFRGSLGALEHNVTDRHKDICISRAPSGAKNKHFE